MDITRRTTLATTCLALVLTAGCTGGTDPADTEASGGDSAAATGADVTGLEEAVTFDTLTGETTRLSLDDGVTSALSAIGVDLTATGGAEAETAGGMTTFSFPVSGGEATVDPEGSPAFTGMVEHEGGLQLSALGRTVTADQLVLDGDQQELTAVVAGRRVTLLPLMTDPQLSSDGEEQATVTYSAASLDTSTVQSFADQLGLPNLPSLEVNELESTLEGS